MQTKEIQQLYEASMRKAAEIIPSWKETVKECTTADEYAIEFANQFDSLLQAFKNIASQKSTKLEEDNSILQGINNALTAQNNKYAKTIESLNKQLLLYKSTSGKVVDNKIASMETKTKVKIKQLKSDNEYLTQQATSKDETIKTQTDEIERLKKLFKAFNSENLSFDKFSSDKLLEDQARHGTFEYNIYIKGQMQPNDIPNQDITRIVKLPMGNLLHVLTTQSKKIEELISKPGCQNEELSAQYNELHQRHLALTEEKEYLIIEIKSLIERQQKLESKYNKITFSLRDLITNSFGDNAYKEETIKLLDLLQLEESVLSPSPLLSPDIQHKDNIGLQVEYLKALFKDNKYKEFADLWKSYNYDEAPEIEDSSAMLSAVVRIRDKQIEELLKQIPKFNPNASLSKISPIKGINDSLDKHIKELKQITSKCVEKLIIIYPQKLEEGEASMQPTSDIAQSISNANKLLVMISTISNIKNGQAAYTERINQIHLLYNEEQDSLSNQKDQYFNDIYTIAKELLLLNSNNHSSPSKVKYISEKLDEANTALVNKDKILFSKQEEAKQIEKALQAKDQLIIALRSENDRINNAHRNKDQDLQNSKQEYESQIAELKSKVNAQQEKEESLIEDANKLKNANKLIQSELDQSKQAINAYSIKLDSLSKDANSKHDESHKSRKAIQELEQDKAKLENLIKEGRKASDNVRQRLEVEIKELKLKLKNNEDEISKYEPIRESYNSMVEIIYNIREECLQPKHQEEENIERVLSNIKEFIKDRLSKIEQLQNAVNILNCEKQTKSKETIKSKNSMAEYWKTEAEMEKNRRKEVEEEINKMIEEHNKSGTLETDESLSNTILNYFSSIDEEYEATKERINSTKIKAMLSKGIQYITTLRNQLEISNYNNDQSSKEEMNEMKKRCKWLEEENQKLLARVKSLEQSLSKYEKSHIEQKVMIESQYKMKQDHKIEELNSQVQSYKEEIYKLNGLILQLQKERDELIELNTQAKYNINNLAESLTKEHEQQKELGKELKVLHEALQSKSKKKYK